MDSSRRISLINFLATAVLAIVLPSSALAARVGRVDVDRSPIYETPSEDANILSSLPRGSVVTASNYPTESFFKVRTRNGTIGFMKADALILEDLSEDSKPEPAPTPEKPKKPSETLQEKSEKFPIPPTSRKPKKERLFVRALGGLNFFNVKDINTLLGVDALANGWSYGAELGIPAGSRFSLFFRIERIGKGIVAQDATTMKAFQLRLSSVPLSGGVDVRLNDSQDLKLCLGAFAGLGLGTNLSSTSLNEAEPNVTSFESGAAHLGVRMNLSFRMTETFHLLLEGGYRYLTTPEITPVTVGNGSTIFAANGQYIPVSLNMSGPFLGAGLGFHF